MAIKKITNKNGISYKITICMGRDATGKQVRHYRTFVPNEKWSEKRTLKEVQNAEFEFKKELQMGYTLNNKQIFSKYADYVIDLKDHTGAKHRTIVRYRELMKRIDAEIGHIKLSELKAQHLNNFYKNLSEPGVRCASDKAYAKIDLLDIIKNKYGSFAKLSQISKVSTSTISSAAKGKKIALNIAQTLCNHLKIDINKSFIIEKDTRGLSNKTIIEYHRLISTILAQAEKEMLVTYNVASRATPPKIERKEARYFQVKDIENIRNCLENEPIKWKLATHLLLITGCRRGEIMGLKWSKIDFGNNQIKIDTALLYSSDKGVYEDTTKTENVRFIKIPNETITLIKEYRNRYLELQLKNGLRWNKTDYLFVQDNGKPMNPDSLTNWLAKFSNKYNLPHINPHAFRHTHVSILYFNGIDSITISKRIGHARVSTTTDIYSHIISQADEQASECAANAILRLAKA